MILKSSRVLLGGHKEPLRIEPATIQVHEGHITSTTPEAGADVVDLGDALITPGFINAHTHLAMSAFRGIGGLAAMRGNVVEDLFYKIEAQLDEADIKAFTRIGAYEALLTGTTAVWDHYYSGMAVAEAIADVGITGVVAPTLQDLSGPGAVLTEAALADTRAIAESAELSRAGVVAAVGPHATDTVSNQLWGTVSSLASQLDLPIHVHVAQSVEEYQRSMDEHGCSPVARMEGLGILDEAHPILLVHGLFVSDEDVMLLDPERHVMGHCPWSQMRFGFPGDVDSWSQAGLMLAVGTDCGACNDTMNVQQELRLLASSRAAVPTWSPPGFAFRSAPSPQTAKELQASRQSHYEQRSRWSRPESLLASVWSTPGNLHPGLPQGAVEPGREANLAVWDPQHPAVWPMLDPMHNLTACNTSPALLNVMVRGNWMGEHGQYHRSILDSEPYQAAINEAGERLTLLLDRMGLN